LAAQTTSLCSCCGYSQGQHCFAAERLFATLQRTLAQSTGAMMWSLRLIGVGIAFLALWAIAIVAVVWITRRVIRAKR